MCLSPKKDTSFCKKGQYREKGEQFFWNVTQMSGFLLCLYVNDVLLDCNGLRKLEWNNIERRALFKIPSSDTIQIVFNT